MIQYGGDYNPEQWPEVTWHDDVRLMRDAGVTMVSLGIFSWSRIQPAEGEFDFEWLDRIIGLLHDGGIAVDLATATASPPPWATTAYPEMLPSDENGAIYWPGGRQHYSPSSPAYRRLAAELVTAIAGRYARHPAVALWHVNNEYGGPIDFSDNAAVAFRAWLREKYGTVDELNRAWGTDFWSQRYTAFEQVIPPRKRSASANPSGVLDFKRFNSDALLSLYLMERDIIRAAGATQPITTNFMGLFHQVDYWRWAREVDVIADDNYPDPNDPQSFRGSAFVRDLMRSLKPDVPWMLMEQASNALNWRPTNAPKAPGQMAATSMQAVARGADAVMFFQWRQSRAGSEKFHSAMLPYAGTDTRTWREIVGLGAELAALPKLAAGSRDATVAIVVDWDNLWALQAPDHPVVLDYPELVRRWHAAAHRAHVQVDLVEPGGDLSPYALVIAPQLYLLRDAAAANLLEFARSGGHLLVTAFSDVVDEHDHFLDGGFLTRLGGPLGVRLEEFGALDLPGGTGQQTATVNTPGGDVVGTLLAEEIRSTGAEVVGRFSDGRLEGGVAFTRNAIGAGVGWYLATIPDPAGTATILAQVMEQAGIEPVLAGLPEQVEVIRRGEAVLLINHGTTAATVPDGTLQPFEYRFVAGP